MRIVVLSDIHGNLLALEAVLAELERDELDHLAILGDLAGYGPDSFGVIQRVMAMGDRWNGADVTVIGGNVDRYLVTGERNPKPINIGPNDSLLDLADDWMHRDQALNWATAQLGYRQYDYLRSIIREESMISLEDGDLLRLYHGTLGDDEGGIYPTTPDDAEVLRPFYTAYGHVGVGGHTHVPMDRVWEDWRLLNPGSVGAPHAQNGAEYLIIESYADGLTVDFRRVAFDVQAVIDQLYECGVPVPAWCADKLRLTPSRA